MLETVLRRQLLAMRLAVVAWFVLVVLTFFAPLATNPRNLLGAFGAFELLAFTGLGLFAYWCHRYRRWLRPLRRPWAMLRQIDVELAAGGGVRQFGHAGFGSLWAGPGFILVSPEWFVRVCPDGIHAADLHEALWVFLTRRPASWWNSEETRHLRVYCRGDRWALIPLGHLDDEAALAELLRLRPELLVGFNAEYLARLAEHPGDVVTAMQRRQRQNTTDEACLYEEMQSLARYEPDPFDDRYWRPHASPLQRHGWSVGAAAAALPRPQLRSIFRAYAGPTLLLSAFRRNLASYTLTAGWFFVIVPILVMRSKPQRLALAWVAVILTIVSGAQIAGLVLRGSGRRKLRQRIAEFGEFDQVVANIDAELREPNSWVASKPFTGAGIIRPEFLAVTRHWVLQMRAHRAVVVPLAEIVWVYKRRTAGPVWLPWSSRRYELAGRTRDGVVWAVESPREIDIDRLCEEFLERHPAVLTGWGRACLDLMEHGAAALTRAYDERVAVFEALPCEKREAWLDASYARFTELAWNAE